MNYIYTLVAGFIAGFVVAWICDTRIHNRLDALHNKLDAVKDALKS